MRGVDNNMMHFCRWQMRSREWLWVFEWQQDHELVQEHLRNPRYHRVAISEDSATSFSPSGYIPLETKPFVGAAALHPAHLQSWPPPLSGAQDGWGWPAGAPRGHWWHAKVPAKVPKRPKAASPKKEAVKVGKVRLPRSIQIPPDPVIQPSELGCLGMSWDVLGCFGIIQHVVRDSQLFWWEEPPGQEASRSSTCFGTSCRRPKSCRVGRDRLHMSMGVSWNGPINQPFWGTPFMKIPKWHVNQFVNETATSWLYRVVSLSSWSPSFSFSSSKAKAKKINDGSSVATAPVTSLAARGGMSLPDVGSMRSFSQAKPKKTSEVPAPAQARRKSACPQQR